MRKIIFMMLAAGCLLPEVTKAQAVPPTGISKDDAAVYKLKNDWADMQKYRQDNVHVQSRGIKEIMVLMGDSITESWGTRDTGFFTENPWLVNRGISGQTTRQMLVRFRQDVIELKPVAVVINAGTNDIAGNTGAETAQEITGNIISMAQLAQANGIIPVLSSITPAAAYRWRKDVNPVPVIAEINASLKKYAAEHKLIYIDYYKPMVAADGALDSTLTTDGVHPTQAGYEVMEPLLLDAAKKVGLVK